MDAATRTYLRNEINRKAREGKAVKNRLARGKMSRTPPTAPLMIPEVLFPTEILREAIFAHAKQNGWGETENMVNTEIANRTGYDAKRLIQLWEQKNVSFDVADYIITRVFVHLWFKDEGLNKVYESIDFRWYDLEWRKEQKRLQTKRKAALARETESKKAKLRGAKLHEERLARARGSAVLSPEDGRKDNPGAPKETLAAMNQKRWAK